MKILQLGMSANHGGVESFVLNYAKEMKKYGVSCDYVDLQGKGLAGSEWILSEGSRIFTLKDYRKHPIQTLKRVKQIVREGNYDCVHINLLSAASLVPTYGALRGGAKVLVHSHNSQTIGLPRKLLHGFHSVILRRLPVTRLACGNMAGNWMHGKKKFEVVPNAIDTQRYRYSEESRKARREELGIGEDTFVLGFVGRLSPQKNPVYLTKILNALRRRGVDDVKLLIVGDGELREAVMAAAADRGIAEDVLCVGVQSNPNEWYSAMDAFLLPSLWEGLPLVGVEAQTAGLPCFLSGQITDEIALTDLVQFLDLTETAENWAEALLGSREKKANRADYADRIGQTPYSIQRSAARLYEIYQNPEA